MRTDFQLYLAPFQGVTGHTFRRIHARHFDGISKYFTPFTTKIDHDTRLSERKEHELQHLSSPTPEVVPQVLSKDPEEILRFARICHIRGFKELNWNLGCPYPQVADKKRGSGMLPYPDMVRDILDKVMPGMPLKFSIKCRLGYDNPDEIFDLVPVFNDYPLHELTLHARIGRQLYSGNADVDAMLKVIPLVKMPFVQNGDILTIADFNAVSSRMPTVSRFMIGRGILCDPFLASELLHEKQHPDKKAKLQHFMDDLYFGYRVDMNDRLTLLNVLKEYWAYLSNWFDEPHQVFKLVNKVKSFDDYEDKIKMVFERFNEKQ